MDKEKLMQIGERFTEFYDSYNPQQFSGAIYPPIPFEFGFEILNEPITRERHIFFQVNSLNDSIKILEYLNRDYVQVLENIIKLLDTQKPDLNKQLYLIINV